jgi:glyoxylate reductase
VDRVPESGSRKRVFVTADVGEATHAKLREAGFDLDVHDSLEAPSYETLVARASSGVFALVTTIRDRIDEPLLASGARAGLRIVAQVAVGIDNIDVGAATRHGVAVANTPDVLSNTTAEFAFFMMGALARKMAPSEELVRSGQWGVWHPHKPWLGHGVSGKTVAVVGAGRIGRAFVNMCVGFDMSVIAVAKRPDEDWRAGVQDVMDIRVRRGHTTVRRTIEFATLDAALEDADFVTLHVPLVKSGPGSTVRLIDSRRLAQMKKTAYLVNTSRGPVVDETALARALLDGTIAGAALDVFEKEPLPMDSPLLDPRLVDRLRLYHHIGSGTYETRLSPDPDVGMSGRAAQSVIDLGRGADPSAMPWVVNRAELRKG